MAEAGYKYLKTYQLATVIYDLTVEFCERFLSGFENRRTKEQMEQAARSGKQNIAEGSQLKSLKGYIYLLGISLGSYKELLEEKFIKEGGYTENLFKRRLEVKKNDY